MNKYYRPEDNPWPEFSQVCREIKELQTPEMIHSSSEELFRTLFVSSPIGIFIVQDGKFQAVNPQFQNITGYSRAELFNLDAMSIVYPEDRDFVRLHAANMLKGKQSLPYQYRIITRDGSLKWVLETVASIEYNGRPAAMGNFMDINNLKQTEEKLRFLSLHDPLTGLYNRTYFEEEMKRLQSGRHYPVGMVICDIDGLKLVNDTLGHDMGDRLLQDAAQTLRKGFRESDVVARVGGDEFAILLPNAPAAAVENCCRRIQEAVAASNQYRSNPPLSISCGYAVGYDPETSMIDLYREADSNMYREKRDKGQEVRNLIYQHYLEALHQLDYGASGHLKRLRQLVVMWAKSIRLPPDSISRLILLAEYHDIGKVGVINDVVANKLILTPEEMNKMRRHCEIGHRIALNSPDLAPIADLILKHHEWWDGNGYPLRLKGEEIPIECRILAIADAYDAMTNDRPYRATRTHAEALEELRRCSHSQFDPRLVDSFINLALPPFPSLSNPALPLFK